MSAADEWGSDVVVRTDAQLRSFAFHPHPPKAAALCQLALALGNNTLQIVNVSAVRFRFSCLDDRICRYLSG